jgi:Phosphopantetheine attachment site
MTEPEEQVAAQLAEHIHAVSGASIGLDTSFFTAGLNSATLVALHGRLRDRFPGLLIAEMFKYPNRRSLARFLASTPGTPGTPGPPGTPGTAAVAVPRAVREDWTAPDARRDLRARIRQRDSGNS